MTDRPLTPGMDDLESALLDLGAAIAFPATPDLASAVGARLRGAAPSGAAARPGKGPATEAIRPTEPARPRPIRRSLARSLLLAAALALLLVAGAFAVRFGLDLLSIEFGPIPSPGPSSGAAVVAPGASASAGPSMSPGPVGRGLRLGAPRTLDDVRAEAPFDVLVPDELGSPDAVYLGGRELRGQVALVYEAGPGLPASRTLDGAGLLVTQNRGEADEGLAHKLVDAGLASVVSLDIEGAQGYWISGEPHGFWYLAPDGTVIEDSGRLVGDTLVWERDGVLYRIEGAISRGQAVEIASSMR